MSRCATAKKISKKVVFSASGDFFPANEQWHINVKAYLHRVLLLAQRYFEFDTGQVLLFSVR